MKILNIIFVFKNAKLNWNKILPGVRIFLNAEITFTLQQLCVGANKLFSAQRNLLVGPHKSRNIFQFRQQQRFFHQLKPY